MKSITYRNLLNTLYIKLKPDERNIIQWCFGRPEDFFIFYDRKNNIVYPSFVNCYDYLINIGSLTYRDLSLMLIKDHQKYEVNLYIGPIPTADYEIGYWWAEIRDKANGYGNYFNLCHKAFRH